MIPRLEFGPHEAVPVEERALAPEFIGAATPWRLPQDNIGNFRRYLGDHLIIIVERAVAITDPYVVLRVEYAPGHHTDLTTFDRESEAALGAGAAAVPTMAVASATFIRPPVRHLLQIGISTLVGT